MSQNGQADKIRGTARTMVILAWVSGLLFATWLFQQILDDRYNPNANLDMHISAEGVREVVLQRNVQGHYVADGAINGRVVTFLLDTGATDVALPEGLAQRLGLPRLQRAISQTANGAVPVWRTRLERVQLGSIELRNVRATIVPSLGDDAAVLLGMSFLKHLEMVQRDGTLTLRQQG